MKEKNKTFLKLHKGYKLPKDNNRKLSNQCCDFFLIKRKINKLAYEIELLSI